MNFGVGTFRVRIYFWPNLNPPLEHLIKVVLTLSHVREFGFILSSTIIKANVKINI